MACAILKCVKNVTTPRTYGPGYGLEAVRRLNEGLSIVMQFSSPAGAQAGAALFLQIAKSAQAGSKSFTVSGVPDAKGVTVTGSAGGSANAYWSVGDCAFGSGIYDATAVSAKAVASPVQTGIRSQAKRVGTTCP